MRQKSTAGPGRRTSKKDAHPEDQLQAALMQFHATAVDQRHAIVFAVPNGEKRDPITAARLTGMSAAARDALPDDIALMPAGLGVLPGTVDLVLLVFGGRTVLIEVKIPQTTYPPADRPAFATQKRLVLHEAGRLSKAQRRFQAGVTQLGHDHRVLRSIEAYADLLEELGVPLRCRPWGPGVLKPRAPQALRRAR